MNKAKMALNAHVKQAMQEHLLSLSWEEKVASIERMNSAGEQAREGMRKALAKGARILERERF